MRRSVSRPATWILRTSQVLLLPFLPSALPHALTPSRFSLGVCAFNGTGWDCSQCSCYNLNAGIPNAEPRSSCARSSCKPEQLTTKRPGKAGGANAGPLSYIIDDVKIFGDPGCASTAGWQSVEGAGALNGDLNQDAKKWDAKDKMYLCYHTSQDPTVKAVVDLKVVEGKRTECSSVGWRYEHVIGGRANEDATKRNADLNSGVGGDSLYLCQAKSTSDSWRGSPALVSLKFYESKGNCPKDYKIIEGKDSANGNFNQNVKGGKSIYLCAKYDTIGEEMDNTETGPLLITFNYLTKAECNSKCLQWPVDTGNECAHPAPRSPQPLVSAYTSHSTLTNALSPGRSDATGSGSTSTTTTRLLVANASSTRRRFPGR